MKFTDGYWHSKENFKINCAAEVRDTRIEKDSLTVYAACKKVNRRGDTLNEPLVTISYTSPLEDVIRVRVTHFIGKLRKGPEFTVADLKPEISCTDNEAEAVFSSGNLSVQINKESENWQVDFSYKGKYLTGNRARSTAYILDNKGDTFIREQLNLGVDEYIYGLGERFTPFVKNGQAVDIWNEDGGTSSEQAYKNIPFYLSNKSYGVFVNDPGKVSYELASEVVSRVQFSVPGSFLEYYIIAGDSMKEVLEKYTTLTAKPSLPPAWSFGLWLTTSFTTSYDEKTVNSFIDGMLERDIPLHVFHFDCFWMKEYQWCDFEWDKAVFPNPETMLQRLKAKGLKICVWINSYIAEKSPLFLEGMKNGYLVKTADGSTWQWDRWQSGMGLVDFTNPDAVKWYQSKLKRLLDMGVDCFKTDFGERIPTDVVYFDGSDPVKMHNYYTFLYNKAVYDVLSETYGKDNAVLFARSATVGSQQFPVHWGGDCSASYSSMAESLRGGLSLGLSGFGFWSHDISGFEKTATPDIYKRWAAFGLLSSHSRLHGNESYRVPWLFDDESVNVLRFFTKLKCGLMPYIYSAACEASNRGLPVMRAMVLEFQNDPNCAPLDLQYMLGDSLLVAPVFNDESMAKYYLPQGIWTNFLTGKTQNGGWYEEKTDYMNIPLFVRPNSIIPVGDENTKTDYDYARNVTYHLFELDENEVASAEIYNAQGALTVTITVRRNSGTLFVNSTPPAESWSLCLRGIHMVASVEGGCANDDILGIVISPDKDVKDLVIQL